MDKRSDGRVNSSQESIHPWLARIVSRHMSRLWQQPIHQATQAAWNRLKAQGDFTTDCVFILDSGCGTGASSRRLAELHPHTIVLGVDQSLSRLSKNGEFDGLLIEGNLMLLRAELSSLWRLMLQEGYQPASHFLFYPNPWPKPGHLKRRWHAHPVFPDMLVLGGAVEMRCNWSVYALEFAAAAAQVCEHEIKVTPYKAETCISLFEQKYKQRGHALYSVKIPAAVCAAYALHRNTQEELASSTGTALEGGGV